MWAPQPLLVHATAVAIGGEGVLLLGHSGAGKSDLALRLIDRGADLVADDQVVLTARDGRLWLAPPARLAGLIELRGLGIHPARHCPRAPALIAFDLDLSPGRMPEIEPRAFCGMPVPTLALDGRTASAPVRVEWAVAMMVRDGQRGFDIDRYFP